MVRGHQLRYQPLLISCSHLSDSAATRLLLRWPIVLLLPFFFKNMSLCPSTSPSPPSSDSSASTASRYQSHQLPPPTLVSGLDGGIYLAAARFVEFVDFMHLFCFSHISWDAHWAYFIIAIPFYLLLCVIFTKGHFIWAWHCLSLISGTAELFSVKSS